MTRDPGSLDELVGGDLTPEERHRLERVHEMLVAAGPPPEVPPYVDAATPPRASIVPYPRRYRAAALGVAAMLAVSLLGFGYVIGRGTTPEEAFTAPMTGAGGAHAELVVFAKDAAGNWPMELTITGLAPLPGRQVYELWLTKKGALVEQCGTFAVSATKTEVPLNAPYVLRDYDGWVVVAQGTTTPVLRTAAV